MTSTQALNPYTYIFNNPLSGTDPTGYNAEFALNQHLASKGIDTQELRNAQAEVSVAIASAFVTAVLIADEASDYIAPVKGIIKKGVKETFKIAVKNGKDFFSKTSKKPDNISDINNKDSSGLGDLTNKEVDQIQAVTDEAGRPLEVVGSAAKSERRGVGSDLPIGKGPGTKSDTDFTTAGSSRDNFNGLEEKLPNADPETPILRGTADPNQGPAIRFEPGQKPQVIQQTGSGTNVSSSSSFKKSIGSNILDDKKAFSDNN